MTRFPLFAAAALALALPAAAQAGPGHGRPAAGCAPAARSTSRSRPARSSWGPAASAAGSSPRLRPEASASISVRSRPAIMRVTDLARHQWQQTSSTWGTDGWAMANGDRLRGQPTFEIVKLAVPAEALSPASCLVSYGF